MGRDSRLRLASGIVRPDGSAATRAPKVVLGYVYGTLHGPFVRSLMALREWDFRSERPLVCGWTSESGIYVGENRNCIVQRFMRTDADWLLQIDTDIEFPPNIAEVMVALAGRDRKILAASVPLSPVSMAEKDGGWTPIPGCAMNRSAVPGVWNYVPEDRITPEGIEVDAVATAVVLIHRDVFTAIADQVGQCWFLQTGPGAVMQDVRDPLSRAAWNGEGPMRDRKYVHIGEDVLFSMRAEDAGFRSHCARVPGLRHHKVVPLSHDFATEPTNIEEAAK